MTDRRKPTPPRRDKWYRKPLALPGINYKESFYHGFQWPYTNRMGTTYLTTLTEKGWTCECMGFTRHGHCKHIKLVHEKMVS